MIDETALNIFTDGSSYSGPRKGGIGIRFVTVNYKGEEVIEDIPLVGYLGATNNQMELYACLLALREASNHPKAYMFEKIIIYTDSMYVVDNHKRAIFEWPRRKWRTALGAPVLNADIWKDLVAEIKKAPRRVYFKWVKGHAKDLHNKAVDKLAKQSAKNALNDPLSVVEVRRKHTDKKVLRGSVEMKGQRISIRIVTCEYLTVQRLYKYRYEVISKRSPNFGNVDFVFSNEVLGTGHHYSVRFNKDTGNPSIAKVFKELDRTTKDKKTETPDSVSN